MRRISPQFETRCTGSCAPLLLLACSLVLWLLLFLLLPGNLFRLLLALPVILIIAIAAAPTVISAGKRSFHNAFGDSRR